MEHRVADLQLAAFGRKEIALAERLNEPAERAEQRGRALPDPLCIDEGETVPDPHLEHDRINEEHRHRDGEQREIAPATGPPGEERERGQERDPLGAREERKARALRDAPRLDYAAQFLGGVARTAGDAPMADAVAAVVASRRTGTAWPEVAALTAMVETRLSAPGM